MNPDLKMNGTLKSVINYMKKFVLITRRNGLIRCEEAGWDSFFYASNTTTDQIFYKLYPYYKMNEDIELI
jgi:hypothetical protein